MGNKKFSRFAALRSSVIVGLLPVTVVVAGCGISTQQEAQMGAQYAADLNRQIPIVSDPTAHRAINVLGDQIARHGSRGIDYTFYIVNANQVNAFAVPGGYVYVNRGLIDRISNWSELAGVLAHEIGHVEERHGVQQMERAQTANMGLTLAYVLLGRSPGGLERAAINVGGSVVFARYGREAEDEADRVAIPLMLAARVDPRGLVSMFNKLMAEQRRSPTRVEQWFSTHPTTQDRVATTQARISRLPASQLRGLTTSSSTFTQLKSRLRQLPAAPAQQALRR
ncbi:MAG TPA: M48 family metallopeptidase [Longimicrobiales bacterium]|nr:M48 family metallopeptidase [Longimicrobiales bacterium]